MGPLWVWVISMVGRMQHMHSLLVTLPEHERRLRRAAGHAVRPLRASCHGGEVGVVLSSGRLG